MIAFIGSVFSPYYARARRSGPADPLDHCAFNVVLYGPRGRSFAKRWAMTERGRRQVSRSDREFRVGNSIMAFDGESLSIEIDERCVPIPHRLRGTIRVKAQMLGADDYIIDPAGRHIWRPVMPSARIDVAMTDPDLCWSGHGYADHNRGSAPLERDFASWTWSRLSLRDGMAILYDTQPRQGAPVSLALRYGLSGAVERFTPPEPVTLPKTAWRIARMVRSETETDAAIRTLEDTPFYARSAVSARLCGESVSGMHESLSLDRFASPIVQLMLPFRMPRRG